MAWPAGTNSAGSVITLTTDFGWVDSYVGVIKGVMAGVAQSRGCPALQLIDLTHGIAPQDVAAGRYHLGQAVQYFPAGTVHLAVVDPGVGTGRDPVAIDFGQGWLVGPDNGLFSAVLERFPARAAVLLNRPEFWLNRQPSSTFHGRDIFAPVAAHLACGVPLAALGEPMDPQGLVQLPITPAVAIPLGAEPEAIQGWRGSVQHIDHFGNVITTIPAQIIQPWGLGWQVQIQAGEPAIPAVKTYGDRRSGACLALVGSHGWVEIAVNGGSAAERLALAVGDAVEASRA